MKNKTQRERGTHTQQQELGMNCEMIHAKCAYKCGSKEPLRTVHKKKAHTHAQKKQNMTTIRTILLKVKWSTSGWSTSRPYRDHLCLSHSSWLCHGVIVYMSASFTTNYSTAVCFFISFFFLFFEKKTFMLVSVQQEEIGGKKRPHINWMHANVNMPRMLMLLLPMPMSVQMSVSLSKCVHTKIIIIHKYGWFILIKVQEKHSKNISYQTMRGHILSFISVACMLLCSFYLIYLSTKP